MSTQNSPLPAVTVIQRLPLNTSTSARINSYNHHSLSPWLGRTGYLTPAYLKERSLAHKPFNMARWLTPTIEPYMLCPPVATLQLSEGQVESLLKAAAGIDHDQVKAAKMKALEQLAAEALKTIPSLNTSNGQNRYFVRMSYCSPKDVDGGSQQPVSDIFSALVKIVASKRTVQALLGLHHEYQSRAISDPENTETLTDARIFFFPYYRDLDRLAEWRCYIRAGRVVAISQSCFHAPNYAGITDAAIESLAAQVRVLWKNIAPALHFHSCALDVYAQVTQADFSVRLIEMNPWGADSGTGSLLFHWLDDQEILDPSLWMVGDPEKTVVRMVEPTGPEDASKPWLSHDEAFKIGRDGIFEDELKCIRERNLAWILDEEHHSKFQKLLGPDSPYGATTRKGGLEKFRDTGKEGGRDDAAAISKQKLKSHPKFVKLQKVHKEKKAKWEQDVRDWNESIAKLPGRKACKTRTTIVLD